MITLLFVIALVGAILVLALVVAGLTLTVADTWIDFKDRMEKRRLGRRIGTAVQDRIQREQLRGGLLHDPYRQP
jgi:hypothetical protein